MKKVLTIITVITILTGTLLIKDIESTNSGMMITFRDNTGYYLEK